MPRTEITRRPSYLSRAGKFLCLSGLLLALATSAGLGQEAGLAPASVGYHQLTTSMFLTAGQVFVANPLHSFSLPWLDYRVTGEKLEGMRTVTFSLDVLFEKQDPQSRYSLRQWIYKRPNDNGWAEFWDHLEAGYGQLCGLECGVGQSIDISGRPACAYLVARFSF